MHSEVDIASAFSHFDQDSSGSLTVEEFAAILAGMGSEPLSEEEIEDIFEAVDKTGDGTVDVEEFVAWLTDAASIGLGNNVTMTAETANPGLNVEGDLISNTNQNALVASSSVPFTSGQVDFSVEIVSGDVGSPSGAFSGMEIGFCQGEPDVVEQYPHRKTLGVSFSEGEWFLSSTGVFFHNTDQVPAPGCHDDDIGSPFRFKKGSVVTAHLDLDTRTANFTVDGKDSGTVFKGVGVEDGEAQPMYAYVTLKQGQLRLLSK